MIGAVAGALALMIGGFNLTLRATLDREADRAVKERAAARLATLRVSDGKITISEDQPDTSLDVGTWIYQGQRAIERPTAEPALDADADRLAGRGATITSIEAAEARLASLPVLGDNGTQIGTVVAGLSDRPYDRTFKVSLIASLALAGLLLALVAFATAAVLRAALRPVSRMTADAADWSEHDLDKRFALGRPHDELTRLAQTLDGLLDRIAASLRRERLLTAEISHELRTPLARITAEADLALRRERSPEEYRAALTAVLDGAEQLNQTIETLLLAAREQPAATRRSADLAAVLERLIADAGISTPSPDGPRLDLALPDRPIRVGANGAVIARIFAPILENARRHAISTITISATEPRGTDITVVIADDGNGIDPVDGERIFEPGVRVSTTTDTHDGPGLGLSLARRLARDIGGDVIVSPSPHGGHFIITLPLG